jgi:LAO/AO transport system kinase
MHKNHEYKSALQVNDGVQQPPSVNEEAVRDFRNRKRRSSFSQDFYVKGILDGNRTILSQSITLIESSLPEHQKVARDIIEKCLPYSGNSIRIGITGVPGVGKSTFIESFGTYITRQKRKLAVLAIDPSSERSKGSIMGDKTRMEELSTNPDAYIRPSPTAGSLGGVARKTRETIILCEAAGFNTVLIETVGVGQSETAVHSMVDFFLLLMLAGAGDELQGIKRGIMEMADAIAITKADGSNVEKALLAKAEYSNALHLFPPSPSGWVPEVHTCSARSNSGILQIWETILGYSELTENNGFFAQRRKMQSKHWMHNTIDEALKQNFYQSPLVASKLAQLEVKVLNNQLSSFEAAKLLLDEYFIGQVSSQTK